ncbi:MAG: peptidase S41, partial [Candidatus Aminicenantes bacterium]|nr:peptidase S41 [Candidatus Aminicenantes bacterium]
MGKRRILCLAAMATAALLVVMDSSCRPNSPDSISHVRNLRTFAKIFGYVRYFHPSDEAAALDWDALAIHGVGLVKEARSTRGLAKALRGLFSPIAPTVTIYPQDEEAPDPLGLFPKATEGLKPVSWQHLGLGQGLANSAYSSVRRNRVNTLNALIEGGVVAQGIDARPFRGREVRLRAFLRTDVRGLASQAQLWLRVDRPGGQRGFFDNMFDRPVRTRAWTEVEIKGPVAEDAERIFFGAILNGQGGLWLDDVRLETKTAEGNWEEATVANAGFEDKGPDELPVGWTTAVQSCLYRVVPDDPHGGGFSLRLEGRRIPQSDRLFEAESRVGDAVRKPLDAGLACAVPLALWSDEKTTLPRGDAAALEELTAALDLIASRKLTAEDEDVRLGGVVIAWNVFQHFYPYFDQIRIDWDGVLSRALEKALTDETAGDFAETLKSMVAALEDGHGNVIYRKPALETGPPFVVGWVERSVVVTKSLETENFKPGDVILTLDGRPADEVVKESWDLISGSPQWKEHKFNWTFGYGPAGSTAKVRLRRDGQELETSFVR